MYYVCTININWRVCHLSTETDSKLMKIQIELLLYPSASTVYNVLPCSSVLQGKVNKKMIINCVRNIKNVLHSIIWIGYNIFLLERANKIINLCAWDGYNSLIWGNYKIGHVCKIVQVSINCSHYVKDKLQICKDPKDLSILLYYMMNLKKLNKRN